MKNDYQCLIELWKKEIVIRKLRNQLIEWKDSIGRRKLDCGRQQQEILDLENELKKIRSSANDLENYFQKTEKTIVRLRDSISTNALGDYETILKQIEQMGATKDDKEMEYLELLEIQDQKKQRQGTVKMQLEAQKRRLSVEATRWRTDGAECKTQIVALKQEQTTVFPFMNSRVLATYQHLAKEHPQVLSKINKGICSSCGVNIPLLIQADVEDKELIRNCSTCRAFLISFYENCS